MNAMRRVWAMPGVIVSLWVTQVAIAALVASGVHGAVASSMREHAVLDDGHLLAYIGQLLFEHPSVAWAVVTAVVTSAVLGLVFWTVVAGGVITRLAGKRGFLPACGRWLPAIAVTSLWHLLLRAVILGILFLGLGMLPGSIATPMLVAAMAFFTCSLDVARTHVVLHEARPFHIRTAAEALLQTAQHPKVLLQSLGLSLVQWAFVAGAFYVALAGMDDGSGVIGARLLGLGALLAGLTRLAVVVEAGRLPVRPRR